MAYNVTEERLKVKGSESITRDLQVNKTIYADNISVNNAQINELNVANIISNSIIENGNKVVNNSILGMNTSSVVFWNTTANQLQTLPVPQADNVVLTGNMDGSLRWDVGGSVNGAPVIALNESYFVDVLDYNVDNGWDAGALYMTTPNGNFYFGNYLYTPSAVYTTPTTVTMVFSNTGYSGTTVTLTLSSPDAVTNAFLGSSSIISATYKNGQPTSLGVNMSLPGSCITNAKYLYVENAAYAFNYCTYMKDCFFFNESLINNAPGGYNPWNMVTNASHMFNGCSNLTASFIIPQNITDAAYMYAGCYTMSSAVPRVPLIVSDNVTNMSRTFYDCRFFNQPITIGNSVTDMSRTFFNCTRFNQPITIGNSVTDMSRTFANCFNLNQPMTIPNSVANMSRTFYNCNLFNQPLTIPNNVTNMAETFSSCDNFNQPITIPNSVTNMSNTFNLCYNFNQPITIPNSVTNMSNTFRGCYNFNQPVIIPDSVTDMSNTFGFCNNFNQPIKIGNDVTNMASTFWGCSNFNQSITIPENVTDLQYTFFDCSLLFNSTKPIHISHNIALGDTSNYIYNALVNNLTGINWAGRILNDA